MRRILLLAFASIVALCAAHAPAVAGTNYTSAGAGNWATTTSWTPNGTPGSGDTVTINHAITCAASATIGASLPNRPPARPTLAQTAGGGSLPGGTYRLIITNVDSGGGESPSSPESFSITLTAGNTLVLNLPSLPSGVTSRNAYLTAAGGAAGTETLYATGITATTYNATSASWNNGTQTQAAAPALPADGTRYAIVIGNTGSLTVNTGATLTCKGEVKQGNGSVTLQGGATFTFDASTSVGTTNTRYACWMGTANNQSNCGWLTSGTSQSSRATISSNSSGGCGWLAVNPGTSDDKWFNLSWAMFSRIGDASTNAIQINPSTAAMVPTFANCGFDTCGQIAWLNAPPASGGWSFTNCWTTNSAVATILNLPAAPASPTTGARLVQNCAFDTRVQLSRYGTFTGNTFLSYYNPTSMGGATASFAGNIVRITVQSAVECPGGSFSGNYIWMDPFDASPTILASGTATATTSQSLTDSGASFTTTWGTSNDGVNHSYTILITGGPGAGQMREIYSNTATAITWKIPMSPVPTTSSTYQIFDCSIVNPHYITGITYAFTADSNIFEFTGSNPNGDCLLHMDVASGTYTITRNIALPNGANGNSGTITLFGADTTQTYVVEHNTWFTAQQSLLAINEAGNQPAGRVSSLQGNIAWFWPAYTSSLTASGQLGPHVANDTSNSVNPANGTLGVITAADYNGKLGLDPAFSGNGYNVNVTSPGTHDVSADPQFVDPTRNLAKWGGTLGITGLPPAFSPAIRAALLAQNDPSSGSYVAGCTPAALIAYVRAGFVPTNAAYQAASYPGDASSADAAGTAWPGGAPGLGAMAYQAGSANPASILPAAARLRPGSGGGWRVTGGGSRVEGHGWRVAGRPGPSLHRPPSTLHPARHPPPSETPSTQREVRRRAG